MSSTNGPVPSDAPPALTPDDVPTVPDVSKEGLENLVRRLANHIFQSGQDIRTLKEEMRLLRAEVALIPKRNEQ
jgi:hypothetical protein